MSDKKERKVSLDIPIFGGIKSFSLMDYNEAQYFLQGFPTKSVMLSFTDSKESLNLDSESAIKVLKILQEH